MMFRFKHFTIYQDQCAMKVGTDGVLLGAWAQGGTKVLDAGTGTGIIALMIAQRYPESRITAVDIDEGAVVQARENIARAHYEQRIAVFHETLQNLGHHQDHVGHYDAVVSNPPFFIDSLSAPNRQRNMARHAETLTYDELMDAAWHLLKDDGELSIIVPFDYCQRMEDEATFRGFFPSRKCAVRTAVSKPVKRYLLSFRKQPCSCLHEQMTLGDVYFQSLVEDFYL